MLSLCKLIYNLLLLFIGNLKIASTWVNLLAIKDCKNYLPNNLASEINLTWYTLPNRGLFLLVRLTDKILTCTDSDRVGWKSSTDLRVITFFQQESLPTYQEKVYSFIDWIEQLYYTLHLWKKYLFEILEKFL